MKKKTFHIGELWNTANTKILYLILDVMRASNGHPKALLKVMIVKCAPGGIQEGGVYEWYKAFCEEDELIVSAE